MRTVVIVVLFLAVVAGGCSKSKSAQDVCHMLTQEGVAQNCASSPPSGIGAGAKEHVDFDLVAVPKQKGQVLAFDNDGAYDSTVTTFQGLAALAGPHRYGSKKAHIFVQMNSEAPAADGEKAKRVVEGL